MAEFSESTPEFRYERKLVCFALGPREVAMLVQLHPALFREIYQERYVNNIYFDTPFLDSYHANVSGIADRLKCRIRWYGKLFGPIENPILELKQKQGFVGRKLAHPLRAFTLGEGFVAANLFDGAGISARQRLYLDSLGPTLLNRYRRRYFLSADGRFRITVDWDLEFHRIDAHSNRFAERAHCPQRVILELKYERDTKGAAEITGRFPFRLSRSSKYVVGIDALYGR